MKMLVTGGAGFIGSHIAEILAHEGHDVMVLDDLSGGFSENIPKNTTFIEGSITDYEFVISLFKRNRFDYVYHLAAYAAEGLSFFIKRFNYENNLIGSVNLINASVNHGVKCFVFASSIAVYGQSKPPFVEEMTPHPEDPYGISKYAVELDLHVSKMMWDLNYIIFRAHNVFGEHQNIGDKYRNVIGIFLNQIMQGKKLTVFGDGGQKRAFSYISDVAPTRNIRLIILLAPCLMPWPQIMKSNTSPHVKKWQMLFPYMTRLNVYSVTNRRSTLKKVSAEWQNGQRRWVLKRARNFQTLK